MGQHLLSTNVCVTLDICAPTFVVWEGRFAPGKTSFRSAPKPQLRAGGLERVLGWGVWFAAGLGAVPRQAGRGGGMSAKREEQGGDRPLATHGTGEGRALFFFPLKGDPDLDFVIPALPMCQVVVDP